MVRMLVWMAPSFVIFSSYLFEVTKHYYFSHLPPPKNQDLLLYCLIYSVSVSVLRAVHLGLPRSKRNPSFAQVKCTRGTPSAWHTTLAALVPSPLLATFLHCRPFWSSGETAEKHFNHFEGRDLLYSCPHESTNNFSASKKKFSVVPNRLLFLWIEFFAKIPEDTC